MAKSKYETHVQPYLDKITEWLKAGATYEEICDENHLNIGNSTFLKYKRLGEEGDSRYIEFVKAITSAREEPNEKVEAAFFLGSFEVEHHGEYPGWKPNLKSHVLEVSRESYVKLFGHEPEVKAIHAGLECGLFLEKFPDLDMISFGPTLRGVHAPGEKLELASLDKFVKHLNDVVLNYK